ncbi:hypothetical protein OJAV_G00235010 [Oryzias javanicus]|uniref:Uncharacterized protein n=1 Tax=Oryzias javanicus TaxID=123683 RepID=A0A437BYR2_ORYJA|nr:hypothetical protein OJAV_G00235010 [Oryzias javanicus]
MKIHPFQQDADLRLPPSARCHDDHGTDLTKAGCSAVHCGRCGRLLPPSRAHAHSAGALDAGPASDAAARKRRARACVGWLSCSGREPPRVRLPDAPPAVDRNRPGCGSAVQWRPLEVSRK